MQEYRGQFLQVFAAVRPYQNDLFSLGRDTAAELVAAIHDDPRSREPFLPRLALVLFTQADEGSKGDSGDSPVRLSELCKGINAGLGSSGRPVDVPLVGCSVASIPDLETSRIHYRAFSLTLVAARERDLEVQVAGSPGFIEEANGHETAWTGCLDKLGQPGEGAVSAGRGYRDDSFVLAFFPGLVKGAKDFKARGLASYEFLRNRISADLAIYGAGAGELGTSQRRCQVMAGSELIPNGYVCAKVRTTLVFKMRMDHHLKMADEVLLVKELKEGRSGRRITAVGVAPEFATVPALQEFETLQAKYGTQDFAFRAIELKDRRESLLFHSVDPQDDCLTLAVGIKRNTLIRPAFFDPSDSFLEQDLTKSLPEEGPAALNLSLICNGIFKLSGTKPEEREETILRQLSQAQASRGATGFPLVSGFVFGEWGVGPELSGRAQYYHSTSLSLADALSPSHKHRQQLEIIDRCSHEMLAVLPDADASEPRLTLRKALALLAEPLFDAVEDLGYDGGLISLANEVDRTLVGTVARGEVWGREKLVVGMDEPDILVRVYREAHEGLAKLHVRDCRLNPFCPREAKAGIVSQTVVPLWDGRRCLGLLQVEHPAQPKQVLDFDGKALVDIAHHLALHLKRVRALETAREIDEAVRFAIACGDEETGWSVFSQAAARALEVPHCTIRVLDSSSHFLRLAGGSREILELTLEHHRAYTSVASGRGPVIKAFHRFREMEAENEGNPQIHVVDDATDDPDLQELAESEPGLARIYNRIGSYALSSLVSTQQGCAGVISFLAFQPHFFSPERRMLVQKIAGDASIIAKLYRSAQRERSMLRTTLSVATIQAEMDKILGSLGQNDTGFSAAARLLVTETSKILPCEACTLHLFSSKCQLRFQAGVRDDLFMDTGLGDTLTLQNHELFLHLATQREIYRAAGDELRAQKRVEARTWSWLERVQGLHSILAIPLTDSQGRSHGVLTLFNQLNEEATPNDALDFNDVPTRLRSFLQEITTHVFERLESRELYTRLAALWGELQAQLAEPASSPVHLDPEAGFCNLAKMLADWLDGQICSVFLIEHPKKELILRGCHGWKVGDKLLRRVSYFLGEGLTGTLAQASEPKVIPSIIADSVRTGKYEREMYGQPDSAHTYELIALPLRQGEEPLGLVTVYRRLPADHAHALGFNQRDVAALRLACQLVSLAVAALAWQTRGEEALDHEPPAIAEILSVAGQMRLQSLNYNELAQRIADRFKADLCGIFLADDATQDTLRLRGANAKLSSYVEKIEITKDAGPVGQAFASQKTEFRDLPKDLEYIGQLHETLHQCLDEPLSNLVAAPMRLGDRCEGVILLVNRNVRGFSEKSARILPQYHLETLGTGILLVRHNIEYADYLDKVQQTMAEHWDAIQANSVLKGIGHSWRNQLQSILDTVSPLRSLTLEQKDKEEYLSQITKTAKSLSRPLDELFEPIHKAGLRERVDLADVVRRAEERNAAFAAERDVRVISQVPNKTFVLGRRTQLVHVVGTIIENAIEACDKNPRKIEIRIPPPGPDGMVRLVISDNGKGIAPDKLPFIFVESFTTNPGKNGRGVGLNFAKSIMLFYGGDIAVKSTLTRGTQMTLWLRGGSHA